MPQTIIPFWLRLNFGKTAKKGPMQVPAPDAYKVLWRSESEKQTGDDQLKADTIQRVCVTTSNA